MCNARSAVLLVSLLSTAGSLQAQSPVITPAGDPSVSIDSIYRLSSEAGKYPDDAVVFLFDDAVLRINADGRGTKTYRQVVHVLRQTAVAGFAERRLRYSPDHEKLTLNWVRVLKPDGTVISEGPAQQQESDVAAAITNPVYVNLKELRLSLGGVAANTIIDIGFTIEELKPYLEGDFYSHFNIHSTASAPVRRSRYLLDLPAAVQPRITETNLNFKGARQEVGGRRVYSWAAADVPRYRPEPFAPDTNSVHMHVVTSMPLTWQAIAQWYDGLSRDRYTLTPAVQGKIRELVASAKNRTDTIRALHRWVAQDIRYVSVSLGVGGYQPRFPEQTVTTGFGDCKDKATLFIAALRSLGMDAHPVLLSSNAATVRPDHPSIRQFNHMIAAVKLATGTIYTDLTAPFTPFGELPAAEQGGFAVVVLPNGRAEEIRLPKATEPRRIAYSIVSTLAESGLLSGYMEETNTGIGFEARRSIFSVPLDSARKAGVMRSLIGLMPGATGDSLEAFDGRNLYAPLRYRIYFSNAKVTAQTGGVSLFTFPFGVMPAANRIRTIEAAGPRKTSINAEEVLRPPPATNITIDMRVTLPEGWQVRLPDDVVATSDFGTYSTDYSQEGRVLRIVRTENSSVGIHPPSRLADVIAFFRAAVADENNRTIVIEPRK